MNPTEVSLAWTASTDDGPYLFYQVFVNGSPNVDTRARTGSPSSMGLTPETTYADHRQSPGLCTAAERVGAEQRRHGDDLCCRRSGHRAALIARQPARLGRRGRGPRNQFVLDAVCSTTRLRKRPSCMRCTRMAFWTIPLGGDRAILYATAGWRKHVHRHRGRRRRQPVGACQYHDSQPIARLHVSAE